MIDHSTRVLIVDEYRRWIDAGFSHNSALEQAFIRCAKLADKSEIYRVCEVAFCYLANRGVIKR